ncbi:hypothetical protein HDU91_003700 [Kappamyces sp. JEL0680]|nr:hypothetical protein HDU91_003700 [Kappamyces sp. JEL0680]
MSEILLFVFKIISESENVALENTLERHWKGSALDHRDGFIHLATLAQLCQVANRFYSQHEALVVLKINTARLADGLRWEPPMSPDQSKQEQETKEARERGELFPHYYGALDLDVDVVQTIRWQRGPDGVFGALDP